MNQFSKRLSFVGGGVVVFILFTLLLSQAVTYKPWGVPDSRRDDYDRKLAEMKERDRLKEDYDNRPKPSVSVLGPQHHFGLVAPGAQLSHSFRVQNDGDAELSLSIHSTSCECLTINLETEKIAPGESANCQVDWKLLSEPETLQQSQRVMLKTNDPFRPSIRLEVASEIKQALVLPESVGFGKHDITEGSTASFVVYSQLLEDLDLKDVVSNDIKFEWAAEPEPVDRGDLLGKEALSAMRVTVVASPETYGHYSGNFRLVFGNAVDSDAQVPFGGSVRPPIGFYGPNVDQRTGVDLGTLESGKQHDFFVTVRSRADASREIEVLDIEPKELEAELMPTETDGVYRLRVSVPADCPDLRFNLDQKRGYVQVGDPLMKNYSNWLPVYGAVANTKRN